MEECFDRLAILACELHENTFGGLAPPGPTAELCAPRTPIVVIRRGEGWEGKGRREEGGKRDGKGGRRRGKEGEGKGGKGREGVKARGICFVAVGGWTPLSTSSTSLT